ncbi:MULTISPECIES: DUF7344 domain-containing protein [Halorussus]|uniref:DUF7344 domain-containing protein n=1 Tax=Halorussus TaxID=1070314 RepID=UPI0020A2292E|nr:hypothetical protein [Halorussus vallis]USZ77971.1 hypothetical protein NGM07_22615 [Halorussus vallis]
MDATIRDGDERGTETVGRRPAAEDGRADDARSTDAVARALSNERRRFVCRHLLESDEPTTVMELATLVAASQRGVAPRALTTDEIARERAELTHTHLPTLKEAGIVAGDETGLELAEDAPNARTLRTESSTDDPSEKSARRRSGGR